MSHKKTCSISVCGMTCNSCEVLIESRLRPLPGIADVRATAHKGMIHIAYHGAEPTIERLAQALKGTKYHVGCNGSTAHAPRSRPAQLLGAVALAFGIGLVFTKLGFLQGAGSLSDSMSIGAAFVLGLVAAASSCVATVGGLMITAVTQYRQSVRISTLKTRVAPVASFIVGRIFSYTILGGVLGAIGAAFSPSATVTGAIVIVAAAYMIIMGLDMLGLAPAWLKRLLPHMPKFLARCMVDGSTAEQRGLIAPFLLGSATFFIPCGFTQSLQIYALTTGSFATSALIMGVFALGTAPALGILGFSLSSFAGRMRTFVFQVAGALVLLMGIVNIQNGLTITGHPLNTAWLKSTPPVQAETGNNGANTAVSFDGTEQIIRMKADYSGYTPDTFTVRAGVPTRWQIDGTKAYGCISSFQVPGLGIRRTLDQSMNEISFTAPKPGQYVFSCSMGMYRGVLNVIANS